MVKKSTRAAKTARPPVKNAVLQRALAAKPAVSNRNLYWYDRVSPSLKQGIDETILAWHEGDSALRELFPVLSNLCTHLAATEPVGVKAQTIKRYANELIGRQP